MVSTMHRDASRIEHVNEVRLVGRMAADASETILPSGDLVVGFRLIVHRAGPPGRPGGPSVDALECSAWSKAVQRTVLRWRAGDVVEVAGRLRRTFRRTPAGPTSRWDVEVSSARRLERAP